MRSSVSIISFIALALTLLVSCGKAETDEPLGPSPSPKPNPSDISIEGAWTESGGGNTFFFDSDGSMSVIDTDEKLSESRNLRKGRYKISRNSRYLVLTNATDGLAELYKISNFSEQAVTISLVEDVGDYFTDLSAPAEEEMSEAVEKYTHSISIVTPVGEKRAFKRISSSKWEKLLAQCEESSLSVPQSVEIGPERSYIEVPVTSSGNWAVKSESKWLTVNPSSGSGNSVITVTAESNTSGSLRKGTLVVSSGSQVCTITVSQTAKEPDDDNVPTAKVQILNKVLLANSAAFTIYWQTVDVTAIIVHGGHVKDYVGLGEEDICRKLLSDGIRFGTDGNFSIDTEPDENYVLYALPFDQDGRRGELLKFTWNSGYTHNEPKAVGELTRVVKGSTYVESTYTVSVTEDRNCHGHYCVLEAIYTKESLSEKMALNDAAAALWVELYIDKCQKFSSDSHSPDIPGYHSDPDNVMIITWGCDNDGNRSRLVDRKFYEISDDNTFREIKKSRSRSFEGSGHRKGGMLMQFTTPNTIEL